METRRIRRRERQRARRIAGLAISVGLLCVALGMALPHNATASVLLFAAAACCLVVLVMRDEQRAPLHGLRGVVRLPLLRSIGATATSFRARVTGTFRAVVLQRFQPTPIALEAADDEAEAWWGASSTDVPALPEPVFAPPSTPPAPSISVLEPVQAAPVQSAHVPAAESRLKVGARQLWSTMRTHAESVTKKARRSSRGEFTTST
jgi:hypothetical protein